MRDSHPLASSETLAEQLVRVSEQLEAVAEKLEDYEEFLTKNRDRSNIRVKSWTNGSFTGELEFNPEAGP
jgi:hypothetical protein